MSRLAVLADIHGNWPALAAVLDDLAAFEVDRVIVAGDAIHWGPCSGRVVQHILDAGWAAIRGNHEFYLLDYGTPRAPALWGDRSRFAGLAWLQGQVTPRQRAAIAAWPDTLSLRFPDAPPIRVVHGSPRGNRDSLARTMPAGELADRLAGVEEPVVIAAHTHLAMDRAVDRWRVLNPGSVGVPLEGRHEASYLLLEGAGYEDGWRATFRRVPFDPAPVLAEIDRLGIVEQWGVVGHLMRAEYATARPCIVPFLRWQAARYPDAPLTLAMLAEFSAIERPIAAPH